jgi:hypothetical protein
VLYEKNGVITEDRFKKLSYIQWWFHYKEIMKQREQKMAETTEIIKIARSMFETLLDRFELLGFMSNPELGKKLYEDKEARKHQAEGTSKHDDLISFFEEMKNSTPETLDIALDPNEFKTKYILPKKKRKVGIEINDKAGD